MNSSLQSWHQYLLLDCYYIMRSLYIIISLEDTIVKDLNLNEFILIIVVLNLNHFLVKTFD